MASLFKKKTVDGKFVSTRISKLNLAEFSLVKSLTFNDTASYTSLVPFLNVAQYTRVGIRIRLRCTRLQSIVGVK